MSVEGSHARIKPLPLASGHGLLHKGNTRTDTCFCWGMAVAYSRYKFVTVSLPKRFRNRHPPHSSWIPGVFYTYFYNHAHRLRLEKLLYLEHSKSSNGFLKPLLDPGGGFTSETAARRFYN